MDDFTFDAPPELLESLDRMDSRVRALEGEHLIRVEDLFPSGFMRRHTGYDSLEAMVDAAGLEAEPVDDLADSEDWNRFVAGHTAFDGWEPMVEAAGRAWARRMLGFH